jgi:hypothetical protein
VAAIAFWSGRVELVREANGAYEHARVTLERPPECEDGGHGAVFYSAFAASHSVYATLYCDAAIVRGSLPKEFDSPR